jgi:hypothetical protein
VKITIHIGATKTGSSALQSHLDQGRGKLAEAQILYPETGVASSAHHLLFAAIHPGAWRMHRNALSDQRSERHGQFHSWMKEILAEAKDRDMKHVVLSSEYLWSRMPEPPIRQMAKALKGHEVRIVACLRRQDRWLEASYLQSVKNGESRNFETWLEAFVARKISADDFLEVLDIYEKGLSPAEMRIELYEFNDITLFTRHMIDVVCDAPMGMILVPKQAKTENRSPDSTGLNRLLEANSKGHNSLAQMMRMGKWLPDSGLRPAGTSESLVVSPEMKRKTLQTNAEINAAIARKWLGRADGHLFDLSDLDS